MKVSRELMARSDIGAVDKLLLADIIDRLGLKSLSWPGVRRLATDLGVSVGTAVASIERLEACGLLVVQRGGNGQRNRYMLPFQSAPDSDAPSPAESAPESDALEESPGSQTAGPDEDRKARKRESPGLLPEALPQSLDTPEFRAAWDEWKAYKVEGRAKLTESTRAKQLKKLAGWGTSRGIAAIELSIASGWKGLFEGKDGTGSKSFAPASPAASLDHLMQRHEPVEEPPHE